MGINKDSNQFTFGFAIAMVVVVGVVLAVTAMALKPFQRENVQQEKMQNILQAINVQLSRSEAENQFFDYVEERITLDYDGNVQESKTKDDPIATLDDGQEVFERDPFNVNVRKEARSLPEGERNYPLYICSKEGEKFYVIPMVGKGLWGPVWGYIALYGDAETVYGANFDHQGETPGLGAEISTASFQDQFKEKKMFDESGDFVSVNVVKSADENDPHEVDGITGGTITSDGVDEMIERTIQVYIPYFNKKKNA